MPVYLRKFYIRKLTEAKKGEAERQAQADKQASAQSRPSISKPNIKR